MTIKDLQEEKRICEDIIRALDKPRRLIDAEHLKKRATDWFGDCWDNYAQSTEDFIEYIDNEPTVDAVEVVRCKDCTHYQEGFRGEHWCTKHSSAYSIMQWSVKEDDFCSWGEKRRE